MDNWILLCAFLFGLSLLLCICGLIVTAIERRQARKYKSPLFIYHI